MASSVSLVATVLNEANSIDALITSLWAQTRLPDEIIIVDGGSTDATLQHLAILQTQSPVPLRVDVLKGCNIAQGRNAAINLAQGDIIVVTDAGVRLPADWLAHLLAPFDTAEPPDLVSGFFRADPQSLFERVLGAITLPRLEEIDPTTFMPSSRSVAFKREVWSDVGGYPEWLDYCEDLVFDFAIKDAGFRFSFAPNAVVWFRPRPSLSSFFRQYYCYGRGDGKADLYIYRHLLRYATYLLLVVSLVLTFWLSPWFLLLTVAAVGAILSRPVRRLIPELRSMSLKQRLLSLMWLPAIVVTGDVAKMLGYPAGVGWRLRHRPKGTWAKRKI